MRNTVVATCSFDGVCPTMRAPAGSCGATIIRACGPAVPRAANATPGIATVRSDVTAMTLTTTERYPRLLRMWPAFCWVRRHDTDHAPVVTDSRHDGVQRRGQPASDDAGVRASSLSGTHRYRGRSWPAPRHGQRS